MSSYRSNRRIVPVALGLSMLAVVVAAGLAPNTGVVQAASNCSYGQCPASNPFPSWALYSIVVIVLAAIIASLLLLRRRRRQPPAEAASMSAWEGGGGAPPAGGGPPMAEAGAPPAGAAAYVETPEDIGTPPPYDEGAASGAAAGAAAGGEPDIDSLMAELDKISGEILKRTPKKGGDPGSSGAPETDEETGN